MAVRAKQRPGPRTALLGGVGRASRALVLMGLALAGCAAPVGVLEPPMAVAPDATRLDMLVATTRAPSPERGVLFSGERADASLASFAVSIPPDDRREIGRVQWPQALPPDPTREFATLDVTALSGPSQIDGWLRRHGAKNRRVLVFVHGFNTRFETALFNFAQIFHDSGAEAAPILFSWPSRGGVFNYVYDRESATFSRDALEKLLRRLAESQNVTEVSVLAHSMGAWLAMESLRQIAIRDGRVPARIRSVILASPDLDVDVFRAQLNSFGERRPNVVVFLSREDRALRLSRGIGGNVARLGGADPAEKPWIEEKGVEVIDLSGAGAGDPLRHSKFAQNPNVVRFLGEELINGASRDQQSELRGQIEGLSMGVAQGVTNAAVFAIGAPLAIVDPDLRRAYSNKAQ
ncbi:alpha/beta hydrolase [Methylocystis echinoides]|jgi:esterase/lipase superfamily enzyme|uniref:alpha/beta hydrolase n=1 Tax=Methylocystis echinoides TaxID=29468 RepID=UPI0034481416